MSVLPMTEHESLLVRRKALKSKAMDQRTDRLSVM